MDISEYMRTIGKKGGKNGTGASKRRSPDHYRKIALNRNKNSEKCNMLCTNFYKCKKNDCIHIKKHSADECFNNKRECSECEEI